MIIYRYVYCARCKTEHYESIPLETSRPCAAKGE
jgi:hypothetical protein